MPRKKFTTMDMVGAAIGGAIVGGVGVALLGKAQNALLPAGASVASTGRMSLDENPSLHPANPFALAQLVIRQKIDWNAIADPLSHAATILGTHRQSLTMPTASSVLMQPLNHPVVASAMRPIVSAARPAGQPAGKLITQKSLPKNTAQKISPNKPAQPAVHTQVTNEQAWLASMGLTCDSWNQMFVGRRLDAINSLPRSLTQAALTSAIAHSGTAYTSEEIGILVERIDDHCAGQQAQWTPPGIIWAPVDDLYPFGGVSVLDPVQGALGDCYFISYLASLAWTASDFITTRSFRKQEIASPPGTASFEFYDNTSHSPSRVDVSYQLPLQSGSYLPVYASSSTGGSWPGMFEKAMAIWAELSPTAGSTELGYARAGHPEMDNAFLGREWSNTIAMERRMPAPAPADTATASDIGNFMTNYAPTYSGGRARVALKAGTPASDPSVGDTRKWQQAVNRYGDIGIVASHAYSLLGWFPQNGRNYLVLRNPWGRHGASGAETAAGSWQGLQLNQNGVFALSIDAFAAFYTIIG